MKLKEGFVLRKVADTHIVVAIGAEVKKLNVMITLNDTGALLWEKLSSGAERSDLIGAILDTFDIDEATASEDVDAFIEKLNTNNLLCD